MSEMLRVRLLGHVGVEGPRGDILLPTAKVRLLSAYLIWRQGDWVRREELRGMLWGESEEDRAAASLRVALHSLRRALRDGGLPSNMLEFRRDAVRVSPDFPCWVDARAFEQSAWEGLADSGTGLDSLVIAASFYTGEFMQEFDADWCRTERLRLADLHLSVRRTLVNRLVSAGLYEAALSHARQWLAADSLDEEAYRALMRIYSAMGQPSRALQQFEECRRILKAELDTVPSEETVELLYELTSRSTPPSPTLTEHSHAFTDSGIGGETAPDGAAVARCPSREVPHGRRNLHTSRKLRLSRNPLRNARLLLTSARAGAQQGDLSFAQVAVQAALETYSRVGDQALQSRARLIAAEVLLSWPDQALAADALVALEPALAHYRAVGPYPELIRGLCLAADACRLMGQVERLAVVAAEGIEAALKVGDASAKAWLTVLLATAYRDMHHLAKAAALFEEVGPCVPYCDDPQQVLGYLVHKAVLCVRAGNLAAADSLLCEALALTKLMPATNPRTRLLEWLAHFELLVARHRQGRRLAKERRTNAFRSSVVAPEAGTYLVSLFARKPYRKREVVKTVAQWLRARIPDTPANILLPSLSLFVEQALAAGLEREAEAWSAVGVRCARARGWPGWVAAFCARRAVALARAGRATLARECCRRAESSVDAGDKLTLAWLDWAQGLVALARDCTEIADHYLSRAERRFRDAGDLRDANQVVAGWPGVPPN